ncbi:unnamed protein product [Colias eurytheme]|nr:unnamed protein product [Colias eurytheme]
MSWLNLNQSLSSLKGQITNFATEVLAEGGAVNNDEEPSRTETLSKELEEKCHNQELEIASLKKINEELQASLQSENVKNYDPEPITTEFLRKWILENLKKETPK